MTSYDSRTQDTETVTFVASVESNVVTHSEIACRDALRSVLRGALRSGDSKVAISEALNRRWNDLRSEIEALGPESQYRLIGLVFHGHRVVGSPVAQTTFAEVLRGECELGSPLKRAATLFLSRPENKELLLTALLRNDVEIADDSDRIVAADMLAQRLMYELRRIDDPFARRIAMPLYSDVLTRFARQAPHDSSSAGHSLEAAFRVNAEALKTNPSAYAAVNLARRSLELLASEPANNDATLHYGVAIRCLPILLEAEGGTRSLDPWTHVGLLELSALKGASPSWICRSVERLLEVVERQGTIVFGQERVPFAAPVWIVEKCLRRLETDLSSASELVEDAKATGRSVDQLVNTGSIRALRDSIALLKDALEVYRGTGYFPVGPEREAPSNLTSFCFETLQIGAVLPIVWSNNHIIGGMVPSISGSRADVAAAVRILESERKDGQPVLDLEPPEFQEWAARYIRHQFGADFLAVLSGAEHRARYDRPLELLYESLGCVRREVRAGLAGETSLEGALQTRVGDCRLTAEWFSILCAVHASIQAYRAVAQFASSALGDSKEPPRESALDGALAGIETTPSPVTFDVYIPGRVNSQYDIPTVQVAASSQRSLIGHFQAMDRDSALTLQGALQNLNDGYQRDNSLLLIRIAGEEWRYVHVREVPDLSELPVEFASLTDWEIVTNAEQHTASVTHDYSKDPTTGLLIGDLGDRKSTLRDAFYTRTLSEPSTPPELRSLYEMWGVTVQKVLPMDGYRGVETPVYIAGEVAVAHANGEAALRPLVITPCSFSGPSQVAFSPAVPGPTVAGRRLEWLENDQKLELLAPIRALNLGESIKREAEIRSFDVYTNAVLAWEGLERSLGGITPAMVSHECTIKPMKVLQRDMEILLERGMESEDLERLCPALSFSVVVNSDEYVEAVQTAIQLLGSLDDTALLSIDNQWSSSDFGGGVRSTIRSDDRIVFEVVFHTPESKKHADKACNLRHIFSDRTLPWNVRRSALELLRVAALSADIPTPKGVERISRIP